MFFFFLGAALFAGSAVFFLFLALLRRMKAERYFGALVLALLLFEIFNAAAFAALFATPAMLQQVLAPMLGYLFVLVLPLGAWVAAPLLATPHSRSTVKMLLLAASVGFGWLHSQHGLLQVRQFADNSIVLMLTSGGKFLFAGLVVAHVLLLSKLEPLLQALAWRAGKRSRMISATLFLLLLTLIAACSLCLIYSRLDHALWLICQIEIGALCTMVALALRHAPQTQEAPPIRLTRLLSSSVMIYAGGYCLALGLLVQLAMKLGGSWHLFVSFFAALGAVVLALVLLTGNSWQQRWARFVDRHWRAESYDFRRELHTLIERLATATTQAELAQAINDGVQEIFASTRCSLWLREERSNSFACFSLNAKESAPHTLSFGPKQIAWLERVGESFLPQQFLNVAENSAAETASMQNHALLTPLQIGPKLLGLLGLGHKSNTSAYREEERRLLDVLAHVASLALHQTYLQQRVLITEQSESISRIASFIAHDLRHAVSTLGLLAHNATAHLDKPEFRSDFLASLNRVAREMHTLVQRLAAVKTGGEATQFEACDAAQLLREVLADAQIAPPVVLELQLEALPQVWWDEEQIRIVLRNLLVNAREAMPHGGVLQVRARSVAENIHLVVSDTGCGMSEEFMRHRLFRPNQTTKAKGLGIGLYQSREIVLAHGGEILVASEVGSGTKFEIVLPCMSKAAQSNSPLEGGLVLQR